MGTSRSPDSETCSPAGRFPISVPSSTTITRDTPTMNRSTGRSIRDFPTGSRPLFRIPLQRTWILQGGNVGDQTRSQDDNNPKADYGLSDENITHTFVASPIYQLPFGRGQRFLGNSGRLVNSLAGGWEVSAIITAHSGFPFTVTSSLDYSNTEFQFAAAGSHLQGNRSEDNYRVVQHKLLHDNRAGSKPSPMDTRASVTPGATSCLNPAYRTGTLLLSNGRRSPAGSRPRFAESFSTHSITRILDLPER